jgi:ABC-type nitrate/sulfonate/bicarbonate transport system permease component
MDWIRLLWAGMLLSGSGIASLALNADSPMKKVFLIVGVLLEGAFGIVVLIAHRKVNALISKLEAGA